MLAQYRSFAFLTRILTNSYWAIAFLGLDKIKLDKKELNHIRQIQVVNSYGLEETYRMVLMETNSSTVSSNVKYAAVLINTSQLEQISQNTSI